ncbi:MAG: dihydropteroate synthase [Coriobacteriales bacterium]|jgi:dihydropteroate synthase|nr:dihydropteroate synthase [Coriobacteriales bacterium]
MVWRCRSFSFDLAQPVIMGILNVTPDSFSDGGEYYDTAAALEQAYRMLAEGAQIIDVGGESTRPGAEEVEQAEELKRVLPIVEHLAADGIAVSVDTRHVAVAEAAIAQGAAIINDVSGFRDPALRELVAASDLGCVVMHMLGEPKSMQLDPVYEDVVSEVREYLMTQAGLLVQAGVDPERICIDPGPGFGKTFQHNLALLRATAELANSGYPLMAAYSRKGFIGKLTGTANPAERVIGSVIVAAWAAAQGARVIRVHDVKATVEALAVWQSINTVEKTTDA